MNLTKSWTNLEPKQRFAVVLLALYVVLFPLAQLGRQQIGEVVVYLSDFVVVLWLLTQLRFVYQFGIRTLIWMRHHPLSWFIAGWAILTLVVGSSMAHQLRPLLIALRVVAYFSFAGSIGLVFANRPYIIRWALLGMGLLLAWLGLLQYLLVPDTRFLLNFGWDDHYYRLLGSFFDPNFAGMGMVLALLVTLSLHSRLPKIWLSSAVLLFTVCAALTFSRSSYLALALAVAISLGLPSALPSWKIKEKLAIGVLSIVGFALALVAAPKPGGEGVKLLRTSSISARATATQSYVAHLRPWTMIFGSGLFVQPKGVEQPAPAAPVLPEATPLQSVFFAADSPETIPDHAQVPDNIFITLISGLGVVGTIGAIALALIFMHDLIRHEHLAAVALGSTLLHAQFNNTLLEPFIFQYLLLFILIPLPSAPRLMSRFRKKKAQPHEH